MKRFWLFVLTALCCMALAACSGGKKQDDEAKSESVYLIDKEITVYVGGTYKFAPTGAKAFTYASDDESVATVSADGVLTGVSEGTAFIDVTAGESTVTCRADVIKEDNYIRLGAATRYVIAGGDVTIKAETVRNGAVTDEKVEFTADKTTGITLAAVSNNEVTATVAETGSYVITAKSGNLVAQCTVKAVGADASVLAKPTLEVEGCATLKWEPVEGASGYAVTINGGEETVTSETSFDVSSVTDGLKFGESAVFAVKALAGADDF